jgi:response regulator RpfG family c-di-GMP phosphodiesterase
MGDSKSNKDTRGVTVWTVLLAVAVMFLYVVAVVTRSVLLGAVGLFALGALVMATLRALRRLPASPYDIRELPAAEATDAHATWTSGWLPGEAVEAPVEERGWIAPDTGPVVAEVAPPPAPEPEPPRKPAIRMPATMDADEVALALLESAASAGPAVAAHLWLEDPSSGTLRLIAAVGSMVPETHPRPLDDDPLGLVLGDGSARMTAIANVRHKDTSATLWRFALPVHSGAASGVAGIDFTDDQVPDSAILVDVTAHLRGALSGALAIHVAQNEIATARMLLDTARELSRQLDPEEVVSHTLARAVKVSDAATGSIMLLDPGTETMSIAASVGLPDDIVRETRVRKGEGIAGWVLATGKPVLIEDLPGREQHYRRTNVRSAVSVPIADEDGLLGVMNVGSRAFPARFTDSHMNALEILGTQTAVALRNARAINSARDLYFATLRALTLAMETKDPYARGGTDRVVEYTTALAGAMHLDELDKQAIEVASLLHDIGMAATGESVSSCSRPLSTFERGLLKMHPVLAAEILEEVPALQSVIPIVYHHHEWFDGQGYVVGLAGEAIPMGSRILAVADAYVAMTSDRPYRDAMSLEEAVSELADKAGTQFDPEVVDAFIDLLRRDPSLTRGVAGE